MITNIFIIILVILILLFVIATIINISSSSSDTTNISSGNFLSPCKVDSDCNRDDNLFCDFDFTCKLGVNGTCTDASDCLLNYNCYSNFCEAHSGDGTFGEPCPCNSADLQCFANQYLSNKSICLYSAGQSCTQNSDCFTYNCTNNTCSALYNNGFPCSIDTDCVSNNCSFNICQAQGVVTGEEGSPCLSTLCGGIQGYEMCTDGTTCICPGSENSREPGTCKTILPYNASCGSDSNSLCSPVFQCINNRCLFNQDNPNITTTGICPVNTSNLNNICVSQPNFPCSSDSDCSNSSCNSTNTNLFYYSFENNFSFEVNQYDINLVRISIPEYATGNSSTSEIPKLTDLSLRLKDHIQYDLDGNTRTTVTFIGYDSENYKVITYFLDYDYTLTAITKPFVYQSGGNAREINNWGQYATNADILSKTILFIYGEDTSGTIYGNVITDSVVWGNSENQIDLSNYGTSQVYPVCTNLILYRNQQPVIGDNTGCTDYYLLAWTNSLTSGSFDIGTGAQNIYGYPGSYNGGDYTFQLSTGFASQDVELIGIDAYDTNDILLYSSATLYYTELTRDNIYQPPTMSTCTFKLPFNNMVPNGGVLKAYIYRTSPLQFIWINSAGKDIMLWTVGNSSYSISTVFSDNQPEKMTTFSYTGETISAIVDNGEREVVVMFSMESINTKYYFPSNINNSYSNFISQKGVFISGNNQC